MLNLRHALLLCGALLSSCVSSPQAAPVPACHPVMLEYTNATGVPLRMRSHYAEGPGARAYESWPLKRKGTQVAPGETLRVGAPACPRPGTILWHALELPDFNSAHQERFVAADVDVPCVCTVRVSGEAPDFSFQHRCAPPRQ